MEWKTFDFKGGRTRSGRKIGEILQGNRFKCSLCVGTGVLPGTKRDEMSGMQGRRLYFFNRTSYGVRLL